jgi:hypothetical protein
LLYIFPLVCCTKQNLATLAAEVKNNKFWHDPWEDSSFPVWPDWANFRLLGDCLLWAFVLKLVN